MTFESKFETFIEENEFEKKRMLIGDRFVSALMCSG